MHRLLLAVCLLALAAALLPAAERARPNVVLVVVDDLGWRDFACTGSRWYETPNVDRLAQQGILCRQAYAPAAICSPSRAAILTGRSPARLGITDWMRFKTADAPDYEAAVAARRAPTAFVEEKGRLACPPNPYWLELDEITVAELLRDAGYATCHVGKWHLGPAPWYPQHQGFDVNVGGCEYGEPPSFFDPWSGGEKDPRRGIPGLAPRTEGEHLTDREIDEAIAWLRAQKGSGRPFYLNLWQYAVHMPIEGRADLVAKYEAKPPVDAQKKPKYAAMVEGVDQAIGRLMAALDELGMAEDTLLIVTSDNGGLNGPTSNLPLRGSKGSQFEGGLRVPFIARWPGRIAPGTVSDVPVIGTDLMPTLCAAAGVAPPTGRPLDGEDLAPVLTGAGALRRDALFWHFPHYRHGSVKPYSIVRQGDWKLIRNWDGPARLQLFDLGKDPEEKNDLAATQTEQAQALDRRLDQWLADVGARLPTR